MHHFIRRIPLLEKRGWPLLRKRYQLISHEDDKQYPPDTASQPSISFLLSSKYFFSAPLFRNAVVRRKIALFVLSSKAGQLLPLLVLFEILVRVGENRKECVGERYACFFLCMMSPLGCVERWHVLYFVAFALCWNVSRRARCRKRATQECMHVPCQSRKTMSSPRLLGSFHSQASLGGSPT